MRSFAIQDASTLVSAPNTIGSQGLHPSIFSALSFFRECIPVEKKANTRNFAVEQFNTPHIMSSTAISCFTLYVLQMSNAISALETNELSPFRDFRSILQVL